VAPGPGTRPEDGHETRLIHQPAVSRDHLAFVYGGDLWIVDPRGHDYGQLPHVNASDSNPMWIGGDVAFISDRSEDSANLFLYERGTHALRQLTHESPWDVRAADAFGNTIVYEVGGRLKSLDLATGTVQAIPIHLSAGSLQARPQWQDASKSISSAVLSPTGKRVLVTALGEVFSVPTKDGAVRNLTGAQAAGALPTSTCPTRPTRATRISTACSSRRSTSRR
jgi:tricorn protease-like protein